MSEQERGDVLNDYQKAKLADAETTMFKNLEGDNIDADGTSESEMRRGVEETKSHTPNEIGQSLRGQGGMYMDELREGTLSEDNDRS